MRLLGIRQEADPCIGMGVLLEVARGRTSFASTNAYLCLCQWMHVGLWHCSAAQVYLLLQKWSPPELHRTQKGLIFTRSDLIAQTRLLTRC